MQLPLFEMAVEEDESGQECTTCKLRLPPSAFRASAYNKKGEPFFKTVCRSCERIRDQGSAKRVKRDYLTLHWKQNGRCAYCEKTEQQKGHKLNIDHCRYTDRTRGLLCRGCNTSIGRLGLDCPPEEIGGRIERLATYLLGYDCHLVAGLVGGDYELPVGVGKPTDNLPPVSETGSEDRKSQKIWGTSEHLEAPVPVESYCPQTDLIFTVIKRSNLHD